MKFYGSVITARIRSMTGRYCFHRCLPVNISGEGVPHPRSGGGGGYPIPGLAGGIPHPRSDWGGYPIPGLAGGVPHPSGTPLTRSGWVPPPPRPGTGYPPPDLGLGTPLDLGWGTPPPQHSEHLIRGGRYASCVHAGGLSCYDIILQMAICISS